MIVLLSGRSLLCEGLAAALGGANHAVVSVPLASGLPLLSSLLRRLEPEILILDASDVRDAGLLFLDALRQQLGGAECPVLLVASGSIPAEERFREAAEQRGLHVLFDAVTFEELVEQIEAIIAGWRKPVVTMVG